jgi:hypothetical protein
MDEREMCVLHVQAKMSTGFAMCRNLVELALNDIENLFA